MEPTCSEWYFAPSEGQQRAHSDFKHVGFRYFALKVETIAHSVGVSEPRQMRHRHVRLVQADDTSMPMNEIYPKASMM